MVQRNLFGEIEMEMIPEPEPIPELPEMPVIMRKSKRRKDFEIGVCKQCGQLLLDDPDNTRIKLNEELCENCDDKLRAKYAQYKNIALIRALRIHKMINR